MTEEAKKDELSYLNGKNGKKLVITKWRTRRRITIATCVWSVIKTLLIFYTIPISKLAVLSEPIVWSYFIEGGIVCAYVGFKSFAKDQMNQ